MLKKKNGDNSKRAKKIVHPTTGPAVDCGCIIVSKPSISLQEYPPKQVTLPTPLSPPIPALILGIIIFQEPSIFTLRLILFIS